MGIFLSNAALALLLLQSQAPPPAASADSLRAALWERVSADSTDGGAWLELGRVYLQRGADYHAHRKPTPVDTAFAHAILDTAQQAFERAARLTTGTRTADSARVYRIYTFGERAFVDWASAGQTAATATGDSLSPRSALAARARGARRELAARVSASGYPAHGERDRYRGGVVSAVRARPATRPRGGADGSLALGQRAALARIARLEDAGGITQRAGTDARGVREHGLRAPAGRADREVEQATARLAVGERDQGRPRAGAGFRVRGAPPGNRRARNVDRSRRGHLSARGDERPRALQGIRHLRARHRTRMSLKRVLVANRGEIAVRVIRACAEEGMQAVAVYSDADRLAPHVRDADAAVPIGPPPSTESYLDIKKLVAAAQSTGCQAVHPGYGFLSERAAFAEACVDAGLVFVGPPASAIRAMGDKTEARRRMQAAGVPVVPGTTAPLRDAVEA